MKAIVFSDVHLGNHSLSYSERKEFKDFLDNIDIDEVDYIIANGDIFELWSRDIISPFLEYVDIVKKFKDFAQSKKVEFVWIAGNHDSHLYNMRGIGEKDVSDWNIYPKWLRTYKKFKIEIPDRDYLFLHGNQFDIRCNNEKVNEQLCHTNDKSGKDINEGYNTGGSWLGNTMVKNIVASGLLPERPFIPPAYSGVLDINQNYENIAEKEKIIKNKAIDYKEENEYLIFGHTHVPFIDDEKMIANCGLISPNGEKTYIEIENKKIELKTF